MTGRFLLFGITWRLPAPAEAFGSHEILRLWNRHSLAKVLLPEQWRLSDACDRLFR